MEPTLKRKRPLDPVELPSSNVLCTPRQILEHSLKVFSVYLDFDLPDPPTFWARYNMSRGELIGIEEKKSVRKNEFFVRYHVDDKLVPENLFFPFDNTNDFAQNVSAFEMALNYALQPRKKKRKLEDLVSRQVLDKLIATKKAKYPCHVCVPDPLMLFIQRS